MLQKQVLEKKLEDHPNFPSLLAISDVLNLWNIANAAYHLSLDNLKELEGPFVVHVNDNGDGLLVIKKVDDDFVHVISNGKVEKKISLEEFGRNFTVHTLIVEASVLSGDIDYKTKKRKELLDQYRSPVVLTGVCAAFLLILFLNEGVQQSFTWRIAILLFVKSAGLFTSTILLVQSINHNNPLVRKFCGGNRNINCDGLLSSSASKVFGTMLSWSEVGFFYFASTLLFIVVLPNIDSSISLLFILALCSLPYTFYSIFYQFRVAKQWCVLCCIIQGLLWTEFISIIQTRHITMQEMTVHDVLIYLICLIIPITAWVFLKPYLLISGEIKPMKKQLKKFKYSRELFLTLLKNSDDFRLLPGEESIIVGNPEAENTITIVSNPNCGPCATLHKSIENWLPIRKTVRLQIILAPNIDEGRDFARRLLSFDLGDDGNRVGEALSDWFGYYETNLDKWLNKYNVEGNSIGESLLQKHADWVRYIKLEHTPTVLINGHKLPETYSLEDAKNFL